MLVYQRRNFYFADGVGGDDEEIVYVEVEIGAYC